MRFHLGLIRFLRELKRRKVFRVGSVYLIVAWGASLGAADLLPAFGVPDWGVRMFVVCAVLGFPVALVLAWAYEISAEGIHLDPADDAVTSPGRAATTVAIDDAADVRVSWNEGDVRRNRAFANAFVIGRDEGSDLRVDDARVSRRHARIFADDGIWHIEDLGSRNGTRLDGRLVSRAPLPARAQIALCPGGPALEVELLRGRGRTRTATAPGHRP